MLLCNLWVPRSLQIGPHSAIETTRDCWVCAQTNSPSQHPVHKGIRIEQEYIYWDLANQFSAATVCDKMTAAINKALAAARKKCLSEVR